MYVRCKDYEERKLVMVAQTRELRLPQARPRHSVLPQGATRQLLRTAPIPVYISRFCGVEQIVDTDWWRQHGFVGLRKLSERFESRIRLVHVFFCPSRKNKGWWVMDADVMNHW
jgi:hypothetical protein